MKAVFLVCFLSIASFCSAFNNDSIAFKNNANQVIDYKSFDIARVPEGLKFNHKAFLGFGLVNFQLNYNFTATYKERVSLGVGAGFQNVSSKIYSASDQHKIIVRSFPVFATLDLKVVDFGTKYLYLKGLYGTANHYNNRNNTKEAGFRPNTMQFGIGFQSDIGDGEREFYMEITQLVSQAKGVFNSNYESAITYDLDLYGVFLTFGIKINSY